MEWSDTIGILMRFAAWAGVVLIALGLLVWWRLREVIRRYRSIRLEFDSLNRSRDAASGRRKEALDIVVARCTKLYRDPFPNSGSISGLVELVRDVAGCYHPDAARPELAVRCARLLWAARRMSERTALLIGSPGFGSLGRLRLRRIRVFYSWFRRFKQSAAVRTAIRYSGASSWVFRSRLVVFPDPISWLAFLSHRLVVMSLLRCMVTDLYLAVGILAVECYDDDDPEAAEEDAAAKVSGFGWFERNEDGYPDPRIRDIRRTLPGVRDSFGPSQWALRWRRAVERAALILASDQFPSSPDPLQEASFGAVVERLSAWFLALSELERKPVIRAVLGVRLETILGVRDLAGGDAAAALGKAFRSCRDVYSCIRVPVTAARWIARGSPGRIAFEAGWTLAGRIVASYCLRYGFDLACREIDLLYRKSRSAGG